MEVPTSPKLQLGSVATQSDSHPTESDEPKQCNIIELPVDPLPTQPTTDTLAKAKRDVFGKYIALHPEYLDEISSHLLLLFLGMQDKPEPFIARKFLRRTRMDWIACLTKPSTSFTDLVASLDSDALKEAYNNQLIFFCWKLLELCGGPLSPLPKQDLSVNEVAIMLAALLEVPYSQPFQVSDPQRMSYALSFSELYSEGGCPTKDEIKRSARALWEQVLFVNLDYFMIPRNILFDSGIRSLERMLQYISDIGPHLPEHFRPHPIVWFLALEPHLHGSLVDSLKYWAKSEEANDLLKTFREELRTNPRLNELGSFLAALLGHQRLLNNHSNCLRPTTYPALKEFHALLQEDVPPTTPEVIEKLSRALLRKLQTNIFEGGPTVLWKNQQSPMSMLWSFFEGKTWPIDPMDWVLEKYWDIRERVCASHPLAYPKAWSEWRKHVYSITYSENLDTGLLDFAATKADKELLDSKEEQTGRSIKILASKHFCFIN